MDFAALVLGPAMAAFAAPITLTPLVSQPNAAAYPARGVYASKPVEEQIEGTDLFHRTHQSQFGIKLSDYAVPPQQGDRIDAPQGSFTIFDVVLDGQGGADLVLRKIL